MIEVGGGRKACTARLLGGSEKNPHYCEIGGGGGGGASAPPAPPVPPPMCTSAPSLPSPMLGLGHPAV